MLMKSILKPEFSVIQVSILDPSHLGESDIDMLDDDAASKGIISARPLYSQKVHDVISLTARRWISECVNSHPQCDDATLYPLPTRVLDVGPTDGSKDPLISVNDDVSLGSWVALSHCCKLTSTFKTNIFQRVIANSKCSQGVGIYPK